MTLFPDSFLVGLLVAGLVLNVRKQNLNAVLYIFVAMILLARIFLLVHLTP
jgi:hypothetical protein